jgi:hypothetical protein
VELEEKLEFALNANAALQLEMKEAISKQEAAFSALERKAVGAQKSCKDQIDLLQKQQTETSQLFLDQQAKFQELLKGLASSVADDLASFNHCSGSDTAPSLNADAKEVVNGMTGAATEHTSKSHHHDDGGRNHGSDDGNHVNNGGEVKPGGVSLETEEKKT